MMATKSAAFTPAATPPEGVLVNFENPPSNAPIIYIVMTTCLVIVTLLVAVRLYTRAFITKPLWWDDLASLLSWIFFLAWFLLMDMGAIENGAGVDIWNLSKQKYARFKRYWRYIMIVSRTDITLAKVAILLLYLRIFVPRLIGSRKMWLWIWGMIIFNVLYCVFFTLLVELQCIGRKINRSGGCLNMQVLIITAAAINLATEIAILAVAVVAIWGLRLPTTRKIAIIALLTFGLAGIACSATRLIWQLVTVNNNATVYNLNVKLLAAGETTIAITAGCLPMVSSFYKYYFERYFSQITSGLTRPRSIETSKGRQKQKLHNPLGNSTTDLVEINISLEEICKV